jgi:hypothetical protein
MQVNEWIVLHSYVMRMPHDSLYVAYYTAIIEPLLGRQNPFCQYTSWRWDGITLPILTLTSSPSCGFPDWNLMCDIELRVLGLAVRSEWEVKAWLDDPRSAMLSSARLPCGWRRGAVASEGKEMPEAFLWPHFKQKKQWKMTFETTW